VKEFQVRWHFVTASLALGQNEVQPYTESDLNEASQLQASSSFVTGIEKKKL
jgi:hypothetical protein